MSVMMSVLTANITDYAFSEGTGTYAPLTAYNVSSISSSLNYEFVTLPFNFTYNGTPYNEIYINRFGYIRFGETTITGSSSNSINSTQTHLTNLAAPLWDNLGFVNGTSQIRYATNGSAPNRVFVVEFNALLWFSTTGTQQFFQVHLFESSNIIRFMYDLQEPAGSPSASIGINASPGGFGNYLSVNPGNPSTVSSEIPTNSVSSYQYYQGFLPSGKWYQFTPPDPNQPPSPAVVISPANEEIGVLETASLNWAAGSGNTSGYKLYFGTTNPPPFIGNLGNVTTFQPVAALQFSTYYFWKVVPYNAIDIEAEDCPVWKFEVRPDPLISTFPARWDFGTSSSSAFPPINWTKHSGILSNPTVLGVNGSGNWNQSDWLNLDGISNKAAKITIMGTANGWLVTPQLQIPDNDYEITFDLALTDWLSSTPPVSTGSDDLFAVLIGDGTTWTPANIVRQWDNQGSPYVFGNIPHTGIYVNLPLGNAGIKQVAFYGISTIANSFSDLFLDNVVVRQIPSAPAIRCVPTSIDFGNVIVNEPSEYRNLLITNIGGGILNLTTTDFIFYGIFSDMFEIDESVLPVSLSAGQFFTVPVRIVPQSEGLKETILRISNIDLAAYLDVSLSGYAFPEGNVFIGSGNNDLNIPVYPSFEYSYSQTIYLQSDIDLSGQHITNVYYYWNGEDVGNQSNNWTIYMGHTTQTSFNGYNDWIPSSELTRVFSGELDIANTPGWIEIALDTPFMYNNNDNLVVAVDENSVGSNSSDAAFFSTGSFENRSILYFSDSINPEPSNPLEAIYIIDGYPNIRFQFEQINVSLPFAPILSEPEDEAENVPVSGLEFIWNPDENGPMPTGYYFSLAAAPGDLFFNDLFFADTEYNMIEPSDGEFEFEYGTTYYWAVIAYNADGESPSSEIWSFTTEEELPPLPPILESPENLSVGIPLEGIEFFWYPNPEGGLPNEYIFSMATDPLNLFDENNSFVLITVYTMIEPEQYGFVFEPGTTYYWAVKAYNNLGISDHSEIWSLTTESIMEVPFAPILSEPEDEAENVPVSGLEFIWNPDENGPMPTGYYFSLAADPEDLFFNDLFFADTEYNMIEPSDGEFEFEYGTTYYWAVIAYNADGESPSSEIWSFTTEEELPPLPPILESPENLSVGIPLEGIEFFWYPNPEGGLPNEYIFSMATDPLNLFDENNSFVLITVYTMMEPEQYGFVFELGTTYYWAVKAYNNLGISDHSEIWSLTTEAPFELEAPLVSISLEDDIVMLTWDSVAGATSYLIYGSEDASALDPWNLLSETDQLSYTYSGTSDKMFFKVVASSQNRSAPDNGSVTTKGE
jgi:hypothetical protein